MLHDEEIIFSTRRHPVAVARPVAGALLTLIAAAAIGFVTSPDDGATPIDLAAGGLAAAIFLRAVVKVLAWRRALVTVTDRRVLETSGLLRARAESVPLGRIVEVVYRRGPAGRLFGYGDLELVCGGESPALYLDRLPRPKSCYRLLSDLLSPGERPRLVLAPDAEDTGPLPRVVS